MLEILVFTSKSLSKELKSISNNSFLLKLILIIRCNPLHFFKTLIVILQ